jgi:hypothetical protein
MTRFLSTIALTIVVACSDVGARPLGDDEIEVMVVAIMASEHKTEIDPLLKEFAKHVQVKQPNLTGFKIQRSTKEPLTLGESKKFLLVDKEFVEVTVNKDRNEKGRVVLTISPPKLGQITYECVCDKYFAMATQHYVGKGKEREQLFFALMAKPCTKK